MSPTLSPTLAILSLLAACGPATGVDTSGDSDGSRAGAGSPPVIALTGSVRGELSYGQKIPLGWAAERDIACWPAHEDRYFAGTHVFYTADLPADTVVQATVTPDSGVDANLYLITVDPTSDALPPEIASAVSCEAGYPAETDSNPGEPDVAAIQGVGSPYRLIIAVAGAQGHTSGGFTLTLEAETD